jgi:hypothetical protein
MNSSEPVSGAIFPTAYFPTVAYLAEMIKHDTVYIEICETYPKQTIRNRCTILSANGLLNLTVPVIKVNGNHTKTSDIQIFSYEPWQLNHFRAIESAYKSSPYYDYYIHHFEKIFTNKFDRLIELNTEILSTIFRILKHKISVHNTNDFVKETHNRFDFRQSFNPKIITNPELFRPYNQVFSNKFPFQPNLSFPDLLFNEGPNSLMYLQKYM